MKGRAGIVVGAQWGDEGKGRVVDVMAERVDLIARYQGGANAGHTVVVGDKKYVFHLLPSGMLYPGKTCVIGGGVVVDPDQLFEELSELQERKEDRARLVVSHAAHVVMPYHKKLDVLDETSRGERRIGTTGRGIGPCYVDKYARSGLRVEDLVDEGRLREKLSHNLEEKNRILTRLYGEKPFSFDELFEKALSWGRMMAPYMGDAFWEVQKTLDGGYSVLFEGAQGTLLDVDHGSYPYVTSSSCIAGGVCSGVGIGPGRIERVIGVLKAYCTRVGEGPFPTELEDETGDRLRTRGFEFGATTGRPRRCGWLDLVAVMYSAGINGLTEFALTKLDVLSGFEEISVCVAYDEDGTQHKRYSLSARNLDQMKPVYKTFEGWNEDLRNCRSFEDLPKAARNFVGFIEQHTGIPVSLIGVGPGREDTVTRGF